MIARFALAFGTLALSTPLLAQEVTLKIAHFLPPAAPAQQKVLQPWCETLKKQSAGRIACQMYPAMQLGGTPAQLVDQVKNGVADIVWTVPGYSAGALSGDRGFRTAFHGQQCHLRQPRHVEGLPAERPV